MPIFMNGEVTYREQVLFIDDEIKHGELGQFLTEKVATVVNNDGTSKKITLSRISLWHPGWGQDQVDKKEVFATAEIDCREDLKQNYYERLKENSRDLPELGKIMRIKRGKNKNFIGEVVCVMKDLMKTKPSLSIILMTEMGETRFTSPKNLEFISEAQPNIFKIGDFVKVRWVNALLKGKIGVILSFEKRYSVDTVKLKFSDGSTSWVFHHEIESSPDIRVLGLLGA